MSFLQVEGRHFLVLGVANRKSVAWHIARILEECGATVVYVVRSPQRRESLKKLLDGREVLVCDVEFQDQIEALGLLLLIIFFILHSGKIILHSGNLLIGHIHSTK